MNTDNIVGEGRKLGGQIDAGIGEATSDPSLRASGITDQIGGQAQKAIGAAKDAAGPVIDQAKQFARDRPWATAALLGTIGLALINTLRGKTVRK